MVSPQDVPQVTISEAAAATLAHTTNFGSVMGDLRIADVSEFQQIDVQQYGSENPALIARAHNSFRIDHQWNAIATAANADPDILWFAAYQYLTQSADPAAAARAFVDTVNPHRVDLVIVDIEEGSGDQSGRQHAWLDTVTGHPEWTYSGDYFARAHGLSVDWIAAYQQHEPTNAHKLWQFTDKQTFKGISAPCDGSVFHGDVHDLIALTSGGPNLEDKMYAPAIANDAQGNEWVFARGVDGCLWARKQIPGKPPQGWFSLFGSITSGVTATLMADGRLAVMARGRDEDKGPVWRRTLGKDGKWEPWYSYGGET